MTIHDDHLARLKKAHDKYVEECNNLELLLKEQQKGCNHTWERKKALFYALGETADGDQCENCGLTRHIQPPKTWMTRLAEKF